MAERRKITQLIAREADLRQKFADERCGHRLSLYLRDHAASDTPCRSPAWQANEVHGLATRL